MATTRTDSPSRGVLSGRGGAGNFGKDQRSAIDGVEDLVTPTLKSEKYTTGRGGSGNIAKNDHGQEARLAQDVEAPIRHEPETNFHYGRGGAANIAKVPAEGKDTLAPKKDKHEAAPRKSHEGIAEKGKEFLDKLLKHDKAEKH